MKRPFPIFLVLLLSILIIGCSTSSLDLDFESGWALPDIAKKVREGNELSKAAVKLLNNRVVYDAAYTSIPYPMGDVPSNRGVCADVVVRAYRGIEIDLQQLVHEDMVRNFRDYPQRWGLCRPDPNIDHRRVPNLMRFFERMGAQLPISRSETDYLPGDVVAWRISNRALHIGVVSSRFIKGSDRPLIVHNIGRGQEMEDCLFSWQIIGHYRALHFK